VTLDVSANVHRLIAAPTGAGKSYFVGFLVEKLYAEQKPFIILDTKTKNHIGLVGLKGLKIIKIKPGATYNWKKIAEYPYLLLIPTIRTKTADLIAQYTAVIDEIYAAGKERVIIVEEAHNYNKNSSLPSPVLELVAREGRGRGVSLWFVTQRIQDFPKLLWSQCYFTYLLKFLIPQDIRYVEALIPNFTDINRKLDRFDVLEYRHVSGDYDIIPHSNINRQTKHYG
jgi:DNA helicase HerA-like ATPase